MRRSSLEMGRKLLRHTVAAVLLLAAGMQCGCRAEAPWPLWDSYAARFLDSQGRVIDHSGQDRTTTEGQAYAMFFALVSGDRARFDKLVEWTEANLAQGDLTARLPAWSWGKAEDGSWKVLDANPAADADLWMAYSLCEAGRLWAFPRYEKLGELMASRVAQQEVVLVPGLGTTLIPGAQGFHPDARTWLLNPSYMPPPLLAYFAKRAPQAPWSEVAQTLPKVLTTHGGFVMDWMSASDVGVKPLGNPGASGQGASQAKAVGSYDAIRMYLWMGISDPHTPGVREGMQQMMAMASYLKKNPLPPAKVDADGGIVAADGPVGFSAAVIPYLHAVGLKAEEHVQEDRLVATKDAKTGLFGRDGLYYDQNLALFSTGWSEQRYRFEADGRLKVKWK